MIDFNGGVIWGFLAGFIGGIIFTVLAALVTVWIEARKDDREWEEMHDKHNTPSA